MKKIAIIVLISIIIVGGILTWWLAGKNQGTGAVVTGTTSVPIASPTSTSKTVIPQPTGNTIDIGTSLGTVTVNNIYKTILGWDDAYLIFQRATAYELLYDTVDSSFVVSVKGGPIGVTRPEAESALLSSLGITQADACKLTVIVGIDPAVDISLSGKALPLSFCASGTFNR